MTEYVWKLTEFVSGHIGRPKAELNILDGSVNGQVVGNLVLGSHFWAALLPLRLNWYRRR